MYKGKLFRGFTLVELAISLLILGLLVAGFLAPLSSRIEQKERQQTQEVLDEIRNALIGYAIINTFLPCPATETDPSNANYGLADASACGSEGFLPWKEIGLTEVDVWGRPRTSSSDPQNGLWRYRVDGGFDQTTGGFLVTAVTINNFIVRNYNSNQLTSTSEPPVAIIYSTGKNLAGDGENADGGSDIVYEQNPYMDNFDDLLIWISRQSLIYRMVQAGRLP